MSISLAETYAHVLRDIEKTVTAKDAVTRFITAVKNRGHERLLPQILAKHSRLQERDSKRMVKVSIASEKERASAKKAVAKEFGDTSDLSINIDPSLVSGFLIEGRDFRVDASGRRALLDLYTKMTAS